MKKRVMAFLGAALLLFALYIPAAAAAARPNPSCPNAASCTYPDCPRGTCTYPDCPRETCTQTGFHQHGGKNYCGVENCAGRHNGRQGGKQGGRHQGNRR